MGENDGAALLLQPVDRGDIGGEDRPFDRRDVIPDLLVERGGLARHPVVIDQIRHLDDAVALGCRRRCGPPLFRLAKCAHLFLSVSSPSFARNEHNWAQKKTGRAGTHYLCRVLSNCKRLAKTTPAAAVASVSLMDPSKKSNRLDRSMAVCVVGGGPAGCRRKHALGIEEMSSSISPAGKPAFPWTVIAAGCLVSLMTFGPRSAMGFFQLADARGHGLGPHHVRPRDGDPEPRLGARTAVLRRDGRQVRHLARAGHFRRPLRGRALRDGACGEPAPGSMSAAACSSGSAWPRAPSRSCMAAFARNVSAERRSFVFGHRHGRRLGRHVRLRADQPGADRAATAGPDTPGLARRGDAGRFRCSRSRSPATRQPAAVRPWPRRNRRSAAALREAFSALAATGS